MSTFKIGEKKERLRSVKIGKLTTVKEVAELGRIYRDARCERIDSGVANRLANILSAMWQCLETAEFERRIAGEPCEHALGLRTCLARLQLTGSLRATASQMNPTCRSPIADTSDAASVKMRAR
jgi:hypothetical protein